MRKRLTGLIKGVLILFGLIGIIGVVLSFTSLPFWAQYNLSITESTLKDDPEQIIVLSGGGMPSGDGLLKTYYAGKLAKEYPDANIVLAMPNDTIKQVGMKNFTRFRASFVQNEIDLSRIVWLQQGYNTHTQANQAYEQFGDSPTMLVTAPVHSFRAVASFRKAGFSQLAGVSTLPDALSEAGLKTYDIDRNVVSSLDLRYNMWSYLIHEVEVLREYTAISYYWLMGWI